MNNYIAKILIQTHICTYTDTHLIKISVLAVTVGYGLLELVIAAL